MKHYRILNENIFAYIKQKLYITYKQIQRQWLNVLYARKTTYMVDTGMADVNI